MPAMTDPADALASFQEMLPLGILQLFNGERDPTLRVHRDEPSPGTQRLTYVHLEGELVTALAMAVNVQPFQGRPCFMIGYAVPTQYRRQGRATAIVKSMLGELTAGFGRAGLLPIYVEAIVAETNIPSRRIAETLLSDSPNPITDELSGLPALQYILRLELPEDI